MRTTVLDSWAIIAWLQGEEPARSTVREILEQGDVSVSIINIGEVFYLVAKRHGAAVAEWFLSEIPTMPIQSLVPGPQTDRGCGSPAESYSTGDPELLALSKREPIELMWIGA